MRASGAKGTRPEVLGEGYVHLRSQSPRTERNALPWAPLPLAHTFPQERVPHPPPASPPRLRPREVAGAAPAPSCSALVW